MIQHTLVEMLQRYCPSDEEISFKERILLFIAQHDDCFERSLAIGHITASSWLLSKDHRKALLMHHAKLNEWFQLGGHCDGTVSYTHLDVYKRQVAEPGVQQNSIQDEFEPFVHEEFENNYSNDSFDDDMFASIQQDMRSRETVNMLAHGKKPEER